MKLIIKEYLSHLKESTELDSLLPDLLLCMGIEPISRAQIGVRQDGVDVAAIGKDPETGQKTVYLFLIKQGDLTRNDWDGGTPQSVRPSLNEILEVYIPTRLDKKYSTLPKKIVVCTGGEKKQAVESGWKGYTDKHQVDNELAYEFWGGDKLSLLIELHMMNENILPADLRSKLRKSLSLLNDPDHDYSEYYEMIDILLFKTGYGDIKKPSTKKKVIKVFRTLNLCQNIIHLWAKEGGNLKPALYYSERTILNAWEYIRQNELYSNQSFINVFLSLCSTLDRVYADYFLKIQEYCYIENGFSGNCRDYVVECISIFEQLGIIANIGNYFLMFGMLQDNKASLENASVVREALKSYIENHLSTSAPCYDRHITEISCCLALLSSFGETQFIKEWIGSIIERVYFSYNFMGRYFPIQSDSFNDLVELNISGAKEKQELFKISSLLPILAEWCIALGFENEYRDIAQITKKSFSDCTLQIWYPDEDSDCFLYKGDFAKESGNAEAPIVLNLEINEMIGRIKKVQEKTVSAEDISSIKNGLIYLPLLASRHFKAPVLPIYWQSKVIDGLKGEAEDS